MLSPVGRGMLVHLLVLSLLSCKTSIVSQLVCSNSSTKKTKFEMKAQKYKVSPCSAGMAGGKYRSFLVHIKAVSDSGMEEGPRPVLRMPSAKPQSSKAHSLSTLLQQAQASKVSIHSSIFSVQHQIHGLKGYPAVFRIIKTNTSITA